MLLSEMHKIMVNKVTFLGFRGGRLPQLPPRIRPWFHVFTIVGASFEMLRLCMFHVKNRCKAQAKQLQSKNILHNNCY